MLKKKKKKKKKKMESVTEVQNLDKAVCIPFCANALRKGMNRFLHPLAMSKL